VVYHFTPFLKGNIGEGINRSVEMVPEDSWVCVRDADTMFLTWRQQHQVEEITKTTDFDLISCMTNRCYPGYCMPGGRLSDNYNILDHIEIAEEREQAHWAEVVPSGYETDPGDGDLLFGHFLLFKKETWKKAGGFSGHLNHDITFSQAVKAQGLKLGVATGVYLFHSFRPGVKTPWFMGKHDPHQLDPAR